jgi:sigma-B regulation protein RsbU (phosphoserine phosphatase)
MLAPESGALEFCNAGHNPPYWLSKDGLVAIEGAKGIILGVQSSAVYTTGWLSLRPGESIYLFTDGVTEAANVEGNMFTEARLEAALRTDATSGSAEIVRLVTSAVREFAGTALPSDDITMLAVHRIDTAMI